jgi:hypothetical protein
VIERDEDSVPELSRKFNELVITAKELDSDKVIETVEQMGGPVSEAARRTQLSAAVRSLYPQAELRSYANDAATFLARKLLIVAVYRPADAQEDDEAGDDDSQQQLFAA